MYKTKSLLVSSLLWWRKLLIDNGKNDGLKDTWQTIRNSFAKHTAQKMKMCIM